MNTTDNGHGDGRPHKYAGKTPEAQAAQAANLTPQASLTSGGYSPAKLKPARRRILRELRVSFPDVRLDRLEVAAHKRARITLMQAFVDEVGLIQHRGRATLRPIVDTLRAEEAGYLGELSKIEDLQRKAAPRAGASLQEIERDIISRRRKQLPAVDAEEAVGDG
jgi:hypothetical protein